MKQTSIKKTFKNMNTKQKYEYIYDYYRFHIIGTVLLILFIVYSLYGLATRKEVYFDLTYVGPYAPQESMINVTNDLNSALFEDDKSKEVIVQYIDSGNTTMLQKLYAQISAQDMDFAVVNKDFIDSNLSSEIFLDLNTINGFSTLSLDDSSLVKVDNVVYGIKIKDLKILNNLNTPENNDDILVVIANSDDSDKFINLLNKCGIQ